MPGRDPESLVQGLLDFIEFLVYDALVDTNSSRYRCAIRTLWIAFRLGAILTPSLTPKLKDVFAAAPLVEHDKEVQKTLVCKAVRGLIDYLVEEKGEISEPTLNLYTRLCKTT